MSIRDSRPFGLNNHNARTVIVASSQVAGNLASMRAMAEPKLVPN